MKHHHARVITVLVLAVLAFSFYRNPELRTGSALSPIPPQHADAFALSIKEPGTRGVWSPRLGVGFTYLAPEKLRVWENGGVIHVEDKTVEVFEIEPAPNIAIAVRDNFLRGTSDQDCYVGLLPIAAAPYQAAAINYPVSDATDRPWWDNDAAARCPEKYRASNGVSYFLMNTEVPDRIAFVRLGQDSVATDGTVLGEGQVPYDWSESIRILE